MLRIHLLTYPNFTQIRSGKQGEFLRSKWNDPMSILGWFYLHWLVRWPAVFQFHHSSHFEIMMHLEKRSGDVNGNFMGIPSGKLT